MNIPPVDVFWVYPDAVEQGVARISVVPLIDGPEDLMLRVEGTSAQPAPGHGFYLHLDKQSAEGLAFELLKVARRPRFDVTQEEIDEIWEILTAPRGGAS